MFGEILRGFEFAVSTGSYIYYLHLSTVCVFAYVFVQVCTYVLIHVVDLHDMHVSACV